MRSFTVGIAVITSVVMGAITKALAEAAALAKEAQSAAISNMGTQMSNVEVSGSYSLHLCACRAALAIHTFYINFYPLFVFRFLF